MSENQILTQDASSENNIGDTKQDTSESSKVINELFLIVLN